MVKRIKPGETVLLSLTKKEQQLLIDIILPPNLEEKIRFGLLKGTHLIFQLNLDDLDEMAGYVAAEANHSKSRRRQDALDAIFSKMQTLLYSYTDEDKR